MAMETRVVVIIAFLIFLGITFIGLIIYLKYKKKKEFIEDIDTKKVTYVEKIV